ncbi:MAG: nitrate reductase molybdenum cofactor assembly chaperone [Alphaproteobacteria bacterium]
MADSFKVLSVLLTYPTAESVAAAPAMHRLIEADALVPGRLRRPLLDLIDELASRDLFDLQERYVLLFDRTRSLSLHLFEHIHGESRDRGQAMVDFMALYERHGLTIEAKELPDYIPLFLEFLSTLPAGEARALLAEPLHILSALRERHDKRGSAYAIVFRTLEAIAEGKVLPGDATDLLSAPDDDPNDLEALDRVWEEEAVTFGPGSAGTVAPGGTCPAARQVLARMDPAANPTAPRGGRIDG